MTTKTVDKDASFSNGASFLCSDAIRAFDAGVFSRAFRIVLGSRSPRRRALLTEAGYRFAVLPSDESVEENEAPGDDPVEYVSRLAFVKARDVVRQLRSNAQVRMRLERELGATKVPWVVVSCDSIALCDGEIMGKPKDRADAECMLRKLSGSRHAVHTGARVWRLGTRAELDTIRWRVETSILQMEVLSEDRLKSYLDSGLWEGKAGAFGYQDGNDWLRLISGSPSNVVGLPLEALAEMLASLT